MRERETRDVTEEVDEIYDIIRNNVIDKVTIRRTRNNILNDSDYKRDIETQGIVFPNILPPSELIYKMGEATRGRFYETLKQLTDGENQEESQWHRNRLCPLPCHRIFLKKSTRESTIMQNTSERPWRVSIAFTW